MEFRLLGPLEVVDGQRLISMPQRQHRVVLAALLLRAGQVVSVDELIGWLWEATPPVHSLAALHTVVARVRRQLGDTAATLIQTRAPGYLADVDRERLDVARFNALVNQASTTRLQDDPEQESRLLTEALALWRGPALADVQADWLRRDVLVELTERRYRALERRVEADLRLGRHAELVPELRALTAEYSLRERLWAQLMLALYRAGRQAEALAVYQSVRKTLVEGMGIEPGEELRRLERDILTNDPGLSPPPGAGIPRPAAEIVAVAEGARGAEGPWRPQRQLPLDVSLYTGREGIISEVAGRLLAGGDTVPVCAIYGGGGVGKSALAIRVAHRVVAWFPDGQWYVSLGGGGPQARDTADVLADLLLTSGMDGSAIPSGTAARAAALRSRLADRRVLLLLDDAADAEQIEPLLPGTPGNAVMVTSRTDLRSLTVSQGGSAIALDVLTETEARELLAAALGAVRAGREPDAVGELAELCARLPLALRIAAANLGRHPGRPIAEHIAELRGDDRLSRLAVAGGRRTAVRAAFDQSYQALGPDHALLFRRLGSVPGPDFTPETVSVLLDTTPDAAADGLEVLATASLLQHHVAGRYKFHDLLRLYATEQARDDDAAENHAAWTRWLAHLVGRTDAAVGQLYFYTVRVRRPSCVPTMGLGFPDDASAKEWLDAERPTIVAATRSAALRGPSDLGWHLADAVRGYLQAARFDDDRWAVAEAGLRAARAIQDASGQAAMLHSLAGLCVNSSRFEDAIQHYLDAIRLRGQAGDEADNKATYHNLGVIYADLGRMTEAAECIERAIALAQEQGDVLGLGMAYASYAAATFDLGRVAEALDRLESVFVARRALRDKGWPGNPYERCVQGACHLHLGQWAEAAAALTTAHDLSRHVGDRFDEASALRLRAELHRNLGRLDEAIDDAAHAVAIAKDLGGQLEVEALTTFGRVRHQASQLPAAITLLQRGRDIAQARRLRRSSAEAGVRLGDALISAQLLPAARAELDFVLLRCREYGYRLLEADATTALARLLLAEGDPAGAQRRAEQAVELHQCLGHVPGVAAAETVRATAGQLA